MAKQQKIRGEELYDAFKDNDVKRYREEVKQSWGNTDAYKQSMARVGKMTKAEIEKKRQRRTYEKARCRNGQRN